MKIIKLIKQNLRNKKQNHMYLSIIKKVIKKLNVIIKSDNLITVLIITKFKKYLNILYSAIDKAIKKNVIHKSWGNKKKSYFSKYFNQLKNKLII